MFKPNREQGTILKFSQETYLFTWIEAFLIDRKAQGMARGTISFYHKKLKLFTNYCESRAISQIDQLNPTELRTFLLHLEEKGHNPGGIHAAFRAVRAFLYWWEQEIEPEDWKNPIKKVKAPKVPIEPIEPVTIPDIEKMIATCEHKTFYGDRDRSILLVLLDTGARAQEFLDIELDDLDQVRGAILIREGKGRKPRTVFIGRQARKTIRRYLKHRQDASPAIWITHDGNRLTYWGLRQVIRRRAEAAEIETPSLHDFRRAFCLAQLLGGRSAKLASY